MKHNLCKDLLTSLLVSVSTFLLVGSPSLLQSASASNEIQIRDLVNRGNVLLSRRLFKEALAEYEAVLQIEPDHAIAKHNIALTHNNWGIYLYSLRRYAEAREQWETALKLNPNDPNVKRNLQIVEKHAPKTVPSENKPRPSGPQDWNPFDESLEKVSAAAKGTGETSTQFSTADATAGQGRYKAGQGVGSSKDSNAANTTVRANGAGTVSDPVSQNGPKAAPNTALGTVSVLANNGDPGKVNGSSESANSHSSLSPSVQPTSSHTGGSAEARTPDTEFGAVKILSSGSGNSQSLEGVSGGTSIPGISTTGSFNTTPTSGPSVRIIGGSSGGASIIGTGSPSSPESVRKNQTAYGSLTTGGAAPAVLASPTIKTARPDGSSVPMSWPVGVNSKLTKTSNSETGPDFLSRRDQAPEGPDGPDGPQTTESTASVEELLAKIENKVYGKVSKKGPILKRLEKLELDTLGKKSSGSVSDRLKVLKDTYGL